MAVFIALSLSLNDFAFADFHTCSRNTFSAVILYNASLPDCGVLSIPLRPSVSSPLDLFEHVDAWNFSKDFEC